MTYLNYLDVTEEDIFLLRISTIITTTSSIAHVMQPACSREIFMRTLKPSTWPAKACCCGALPRSYLLCGSSSPWPFQRRRRHTARPLQFRSLPPLLAAVCKQAELVACSIAETPCYRGHCITAARGWLIAGPNSTRSA